MSITQVESKIPWLQCFEFKDKFAGVVIIDSIETDASGYIPAYCSMEVDGMLFMHTIKILKNSSLPENINNTLQKIISLSQTAYNKYIKKQRMANNRLFIGNMETGEFACIAKDADNGTWRPINEVGLSDLNRILQTDSIWNNKTDIVFFTESDSPLYYFFHNKTNDLWHDKPAPLPKK